MPSNPDFDRAFTEAISLFKDLLRVDTTNPPGNERAAADVLARVFDRERIDFRIIESEPGRANLVARLRGSGEAGPLLLNGHLDVVPAEPDKWRYPPFSATEAEGCIWGRGAIDMKNMVAMSAMVLVLLKRSGVTLRRDLIFSAVADEEAGSHQGAEFLAREHPDLVRAEYALNEVGGHTLHLGGARFYPIQVAEKGVAWLGLTAHGAPGHGSMPHPNNAVVRLARAVHALGCTRLPDHAVPVVAHFIRTIAGHAKLPERAVLPLVLDRRFSRYVLGLLERVSLEQAISINALLRNTVSPTKLSAGRKINVIPSSASAELDGRTLPGQTLHSFLAEVESVIGKDLEVRVLDHHEPVVFSSSTPLYDSISATLARHDPGSITVPYMIPGFTDAFAYAKLGTICYGFAPVKLEAGLNFTSLYHGHDERIPVSGFTWGLSVLYELVKGFCGT